VLELSGVEDGIWGAGLTIVIAVPLMVVIAAACIFMNSKEAPVIGGAICCLTRLFWLVIGPIILVNLGVINDNIDLNLSTTEEF